MLLQTIFFPVEDHLRERQGEITCIDYKLLGLDIGYKAVKSIRKEVFSNYGKSVSPEKDHWTQDPVRTARAKGVAHASLS